MSDSTQYGGQHGQRSLSRMRLTYEQTMDRLREEYADTPAGYHDTEARSAAEKRIKECLKECMLMEHASVRSLPLPCQPFTGRREPLQKIRGLLDGGSRIILITGMGGIGKTALMTAFARDADAAPSGYDLILYLPVESGIRNAILDDAVLTISGMQWSARRYRSQRSYYREKLNILRALAGTKKMLLLADDIRQVCAAELEDLLSVPADILMTSRLTSGAFQCLQAAYQPAEIPLREMPELELEALAALLRPDLADDMLERYRIECTRLQGHTLALKLWLLSGGSLPERDSGGRLFFIDRNPGRDAERMLTALTLLPAEGVPRKWAEQICRTPPDLTDRLAERSLVQLSTSSEDRQQLSLHPLVAENIRLTFRPTVKKCRSLLKNLASDVADAWNRPRGEMLPRLSSVQSILKALPERPPWMASVFDRLFTFLWVMEDYQGAEQGYTELFRSVVCSRGEHSQEAGWMAIRFGAVFHNSLRFKEAEYWYERGLMTLRACRPEDRDYWWQRMEACGKCSRGPRFRGETDRLFALLNEAEDVYRHAPEEAWTDRLLLTEAYHSRRFASACLESGQLERAQELRRRMHDEMSLYFAHCGSDVPKQLDLRETEIEFELAEGNYKTAAVLLEENLRGYTQYRGACHEDTLRCAEQLADLLIREDPFSDGTSSRYRARELYLQTASGLRRQYPGEPNWLARVEERIREL